MALLTCKTFETPSIRSRRTYLISSGAVAVEGKRFATLRSGQYFGEMALLFSMLRTATCRAVQYSDVFCYNDLHDIVEGSGKHYKGYKMRIREKGA